MNLGSRQYANLTEHSYDRKGTMHELVNKVVELEGVKYKVLEFVDNPRTGYQGTIYQHVGSGAIVVAHRGTEFERQRWHDLIKTDGAMVLARVNLQAEDAIALTERARSISSDIGFRKGRTPEVTVTGHSLGGTLAQITAHYYDLRGETFNAYGAASLNRQIPEGGSRVLNHVMAADTVSSASPHYGQVRVYAQEREIGMLRDTGYANNDSRLLDPRASLVAGVRGFGSHDMHLFLNVDGDGRPDRSVLADARTRDLAREYAPMIAKYRVDVERLREGVTVISRGPGGVLLDGIDRLRGTVPAGEPAASEERERLQRESWEAKTAATLSYYRVDHWRRAVQERDEPTRIPPLLERPSPRMEVERILAAAGLSLRAIVAGADGEPSGEAGRTGADHGALAACRAKTAAGARCGPMMAGGLSMPVPRWAKPWSANKGKRSTKTTLATAEVGR